MSMIKVYFNNGNTAIINRDKASFRDNDGTHFTLGVDDDSEDNRPAHQLVIRVMGARLQRGGSGE